MHLRPDQIAFCRSIELALRQPPHTVLAVAPTGSGKTVCFSALTQAWTTQSLYHRVMLLVHRRELLEQISRCLSSWGVEHGLIAPDCPNYKARRVQVASVQTLVRRLGDYEPPDTLVIDEAHHAIVRSSWGKLFRAWPHARRLGVTATPERLSGEGLRDTFATMVLGPTVESLIEAGSLSRYRLFAPPTHAADRVAKRMGDYVRKDLEGAMNTRTITGDAVEHYLRHAKGKRAMVFCVSIAHAEAVAAQFTAAGIPALSIDGQRTPRERASILAEFAAGRTQVLTSCDLVSEGFDLPAVEVAILLRPTQSLALYLQQVGRSLRPYPGKAAAIILDHAGNTEKHGLPDDAREWSLDGKEERKKKEGDRPPSVKVCPACFAAVSPSVVVCPECAYQFVSERKIAQVEGTLTEVDVAAQRRAARQEQGHAASFDELVALGRSRGYRHPTGWARFVWEARQKREQPLSDSEARQWRILQARR